MAFVALVALSAVSALSACGSTESASEPTAATTAPVRHVDDAVAAHFAGDRPANVPAAYTVTPFGYFDPACLSPMGDGERVGRDGRIVGRDGSTRAAPSCASSHFDPTGREKPIATDGGIADAGATDAAAVYKGWQEDFSTRATGAVSYLTATWTVPQSPLAGDNGQILYFFNGLEGLPTVESILQPVLTYSGGTWTARSWNCCAQGTVYYADSIPVSPGDTIIGFINGFDCDASTGICDDWSIETVDMQSHQSSILETSSWGVALDWLFPGVMEVYGVHSCADLPASGSLAFSDLYYTTVSETGASPSWSFSKGNTIAPCGYDGIDNGFGVVLDFPGAADGGKIPSLDYTFRPQSASSSCMDARYGDTGDGTQIQEYACNGTGSQVFAEQDNGDGTVSLYNPQSKKCVDIAGAQTANGTKVQLYTCNGGVNQKFALKSAVGETVTLVNPYSKKCLDVQDDRSANDTVIQLYDCNGTNAQRWKVDATK